MFTSKRLFLLDAYALIYRSYYAFIKNPRINSKGQNTSAIFGFVNTLEDLLKRENPSHLAIGFDPSGPTFRHEAYEAYKAQRPETPEVIRWSVPYIKEIIKAYRIPVLEVPGFEADDVIGTLSQKAEKAGFDVYMMTPDKDYGQLVTEHTFIYKPRYGSSEFDVLGIEEVKENYGLHHPSQMIDLLSLMGDASDNIPGCPGVGKITAQKLLKEFDSVENLLQNTHSLKGALKEKIENNKETILFSKFLATIRTDVPIGFDEESLRMIPRDEEKIQPIFEALEFKTWLKKGSASSGYVSSPKISENQSTIIFQAASKPMEKTAEKKVSPVKTAYGLQFSLWDEDGNASSSPTPSNPFVENTPAASQEETSLFSTEIQPIFPNGSSEESEYSILADSKSTAHSYYILDSEEKIAHFIADFSVSDFFCFDTETTQLDALEAELVGISFSKQEKEAYYLPCPEKRNECQALLEKLRPLFENPGILKIGQNLKFDILVLRNYRISVQGPLFDTMIAHYLLQPELRHNLDYLAEIYLHYQTIPIEALIGPKGRQKSMRDVPLEEIAEYAAEDADIALRLKNILQKEIEKEQLQTLCYDIENPLIYVLADMEATGVRLDTAAMKSYSVELTQHMKQLEQTIFDIAGYSFNINSAKQIGELLFEKLQLIDKAKKTKSGQYSTSEDVLNKLKGKHVIINKILEYRGIKKLLGTYIDAFPLLVRFKTGRIHTSFNQAITATGRLSSSNPNLQNIPIRDEMGKEIRKVFAAEEGFVFLSADYSQIELRIMAHLSQDKNMIEAFSLDQDIHTATAAKIFKVPIEHVSPEMRRKAKTANFGIIYGISTFGLAERMGVSRTEAKNLIDGYFETYPQIKTYMEHSIQEAKEKGWVETLLHRRRYLPDIVSHNAVVRGYAERNAINAPIQGTAADIIKIAMVRIFQSIEKQGLKTKMIMQVHDELNFIVPENEVEQIKSIVCKEMEAAMKLNVPLKADIGIGKNWLEAH